MYASRQTAKQVFHILDASGATAANACIQAVRDA
jgi:hypothetical protein